MTGSPNKAGRIFLLIAFLKRDVAPVAVGAIVGGMLYASVRALAL
jgi:hypothetical protein